LTKIADQDTRDFVDLCIRFDPKTRPNVQELLAHPFLSSEKSVPTDAGDISHQASVATIPSESSSSNSLFDAEAERTAVEMLKKMSTSDTASGPDTALNSTGVVESSPATVLSSPTLAVGSSPAGVEAPIASIAPSMVYTHQEAALGTAKLAVVKTVDSSVEAPKAKVSPPIAPTVVYTHEEAANYRKASKSDPPLPQPALFNNVVPRDEDHGKYVIKPVEKKFPDPHEVQRVIVDLVSKDSTDESIIQLRLTYKEKEKINFPFNLKEDTATDVISEMVSENILDGDDQSLARRKLEETIREHYISMKGSTASSSSDHDISSTSLEEITRDSSTATVDVFFFILTHYRQI
jgi:hypothetical protein